MTTWKEEDDMAGEDDINNNNIPDTLTTKLIVAVRNEQGAPEILPYPHGLLAQALRELDSLGKTAQEEEAALESQRGGGGGGGSSAASLMMGTASAASNNLLPFQAPDITRLDMQRLQYLVSELVRTRVAKIQNFAFTILHESRAAASGSAGGQSPSGSAASPTQTSQTSSGAAAAASAGAADSASMLSGDTARSATSGSGSGGGNWDVVLSDNEKLLAARLAQITHTCMMNSGMSQLPESLQYLTPNPPRAEGKEVLAQPKLDKYVFVMCLEDLGHIEAISATCMRGDVHLATYGAFRDHLLEGRARLL